MQLASRFGRNQHVLRSNAPLSDEQISAVAPSIFAEEKHASRSERYTYIPTSDVLRGLRKEGFSPFMVCQTRTRDDAKRDHTKHMIRLRHASQIDGKEANEIILLNSHDGSSSYQMLSGVFRFVCSNGMVCGDILSDIRIRHKGNIVDNVIEGAFRVLDDFELVNGQKDGMKSLTLNEEEQAAFARAALSLKYDTELTPAPITENQILRPKRMEDRSDDLWTTFNCVQENLVRGGLRGRSATGQVSTTREVKGIDQNIKLNRALWVLAEEMRKIKG
ncbi:DUF932 domain-containing protein [Glaciimonas sp. Cout2]|uniref:DUF932 domain-containing protein n=1 Tax=Glaciimonas sp. Cout2 TaxID=3048621 RepID=UPI002B229F1D|nr:DUF932 domain-containing protein [Glaciimonas sp. Cout2]MEB0014544.1 DUF932 domain-containing protein [Glaciimonas sp. Cout2]